MKFRLIVRKVENRGENIKLGKHETGSKPKYSKGICYKYKNNGKKLLQTFATFQFFHLFLGKRWILFVYCFLQILDHYMIS